MLLEQMEREAFERLVQEEFDGLPARFREALENIHIIVSDELREGRSARGKGLLLGLYEGVPLTKRGSDYGVWPVVPDRITLFQKNIESLTEDAAALRRLVADTLIHEIGHYLGMSEAEIRRAGY